jgi:hypothetical protein
LSNIVLETMKFSAAIVLASVGSAAAFSGSS